MIVACIDDDMSLTVANFTTMHACLLVYCFHLYQFIDQLHKSTALIHISAPHVEVLVHRDHKGLPFVMQLLMKQCSHTYR